MAREVLLAAVIGAQGLKGAVTVKLFTAVPEALSSYGPLHDARGRKYEITAFRAGKPGEAVICFSGIADRNAAEALKGVELFVPRGALPATAEDEFYHADLMGLAVKDDTGATIGKIVSVQNFGGGDILDVTLAGRKGVLIPFTQAAVPEVAITQGFVRVDAVAAGLVGDDDPDAPGRDEFKPEGRPRGPKDAGGNR